VNVSNPENPYEVGYCDPGGGIAKSVSVSGDYAYVADGSVYILNVSDPENPFEVGHYYTPGYAWGVTVSGDYTYVADRNSGLRIKGLLILNVSDPENPERVGYYDTPGFAERVALSEDGLIFVADNTNVGIYRFSDPAKADYPVVSIPVKFNLSAAYPNPFNSMTRLSYGLPLSSDVSVRLYDVRGRLISTLVDCKQTTGRYTVMWNGLNASAGVYLVQMEADEFSAVRKVVLVK